MANIGVFIACISGGRHMEKLLSGVQSGLIATGPMTLAMVIIEGLLKPDERSPLPPATITFEACESIGAEDVPENVQTLMTTFSHLVYGAVAGGVYGQTLARNKKVHPILKGVIFGSSFWAVNYLVLLPMMNFRASGFKMTPKRNLMMFTSHLVWGACLGYLEANFEKKGYQELAGSNQAAKAE